MDKNIKSWYDPEVDIFYLALRPGDIVDSNEIDVGIILEYDDKGEVAGIEIHKARSRILEVISESLGNMISERIQTLKMSQL